MSGYFTQQIVVSLLARTDALFVPSRGPMANRHRVVTQRRARFRSRGLPWSSDAVMSGLDETGRKQVERDLDDLVGRGIATSFGKGLKTLGVRLTDEGDDLHESTVRPMPTHAEDLRERSKQRAARAERLAGELAEVEKLYAQLDVRIKPLRERLLEP